MSSAFEILCDFDGTIALEDVTDTLLTALAAPQWLDIERDWTDGVIGSRECMTRQVALLRGDWSDLGRVVDTVALDPHFADFAASCAASGIPLTVVSDGLDQAIKRLLAREGLSLPIRANRLCRDAAGAWFLETPFAAPECRVDAAHCKCAGLPRAAGITTVVIGDGRSDVCVAERADFVFARSLPDGPSTLLRHCRDRGLPHLPYETFADVKAGLGVLQGRAGWPARIKESLVHG